MISDIKVAIATKLHCLYPHCTIYDEDVPQKFFKPSFLISIVDQQYKKVLNNKYSGTLLIDLAYFTEKLHAIKNDCLTVQEELLRQFDLFGTFRATDKQCEIVDEVLHFTFKIKYKEMNQLEFVAMEKLLKNIGMEE